MHLIDELGAAKAAISGLKAEEELLKARLILLASKTPGKLYTDEGEVFRAAVSWGRTTTTDWKAVADALAQYYDAPPDLVARLMKANTSTGQLTPTVRVSARRVSA